MRFSLSTKLGSGTYGTVYNATDTYTGQKVALKIMNLPDREETIEFVNEIAVTRYLCKNGAAAYVICSYKQGMIAADLRVETDPIVYPGLDLHGYIALPFMSTILLDILGKKGTARRAVPIMESLLQGLGVLHKLGIVHRDIKPSNLAVTENWDIKILDFGLACEEPRVRNQLDWERALVSHEIARDVETLDDSTADRSVATAIAQLHAPQDFQCTDWRTMGKYPRMPFFTDGLDTFPDLFNLDVYAAGFVFLDLINNGTFPYEPRLPRRPHTRKDLARMIVIAADMYVKRYWSSTKFVALVGGLFDWLGFYTNGRYTTTNYNYDYTLDDAKAFVSALPKRKADEFSNDTTNKLMLDQFVRNLAIPDNVPTPISSPGGRRSLLL